MMRSGFNCSRARAVMVDNNGDHNDANVACDRWRTNRNGFLLRSGERSPHCTHLRWGSFKCSQQHLGADLVRTSPPRGLQLRPKPTPVLQLRPRLPRVLQRGPELPRRPLRQRLLRYRCLDPTGRRRPGGARDFFSGATICHCESGLFLSSQTISKIPMWDSNQLGGIVRATGGSADPHCDPF